MGFSVLCQCENCGSVEKTEIYTDGVEGEYSFEVESDKTCDSYEFDSFDDLARHTEGDFGTTFVGGDKRDPDSFKLLCGICRAKVRKVEKKLGNSRQKKIRTALKGN